MSDSEEFLSAEEDYDEVEDKTECNIKEKVFSNDGRERKNVQQKEKMVSKPQKEIKIQSEAPIGIKSSKIKASEEDFLSNVNETVEKTLNEGRKNSDSVKKNEVQLDLDREEGQKSKKDIKIKTYEKGISVKTKLVKISENADIEKTVEKSNEINKILGNFDIEAKCSDTNEKIKEQNNCKVQENIMNCSSTYSNKEEKIEQKVTQEKNLDKNVKKGNETIENLNYDHSSNNVKLSVVNKDKNSYISSKIENTSEQELSKQKPSESPKEENWDFDDWGDTKEKENEEKGWDDFDDNEEWIATNEVSKNLDNDNKDSSKPKPVSNNNENIGDESTSSLPSQKKIQNSFEDFAQSSQNIAWNGWKPWGGVMTSILSTASEGVTSITTHVSQVLENSIGIPEPEELVKINQKLEEQLLSSGSEKLSDEINEEKKEQQSRLIGIVSGVTTIGNKVISGGLDTLEGIGKKTMNILQENDPLLLNKRRIIGLEGSNPNLSQVLREAKEKSEEIERNLKQAQKHSYKKQLHFETLFDHYYGLVHLEALEMLSRQCDIKIQSLMTPLSGKALEEIKETLNEVKELCDLDDIESDDHDEAYSAENLQKDLKAATQDFGIPTDFTEIIECWQKNIDYLQEKIEDSHDVFEKGLRCLAETCALQMNKMHKIAELLIIKESHSTVSEADSLVQITTIFSRHLKGVANKFCCKLNTFEQTEEVKTSITNIFLEVYNSTSYVQSAFKLFIPILQVGAA